MRKTQTARVARAHRRVAPETNWADWISTDGAAARDGAISPPATLHSGIARLAYSYWEQRGRPEGSPEEDWLRAEAEIRNRQNSATQATAPA